MTDTIETRPAPGRRKLLKTVLGTSALLGAAGSVRAEQEFEGYPEAYGVLTDLSLCVGCRSCEKACNARNHLPPPEKPFEDATAFKELRRPTEKALTVVNQYANPKDKDQPIFRKIQCNHCQEPACATSCPIHAYTKTKEGAVKYDPDLCFGCRYCMTACPFYVPSYDYWSATQPVISKCDMCQDRIAAGRPTACVESCPTGALTFGRREELLKLAHSRIEKNPGKYVNHVYGEKEVGGTNWLYLSPVPFEQVGFPQNLPNKPLIEATKGFLGSVPVVLAVWPALFSMAFSALRHRDGIAEEELAKAKKEKQP
jgi:Fe-S-cluster-containing dehydrogenase component